MSGNEWLITMDQENAIGAGGKGGKPDTCRVTRTPLVHLEDIATAIADDGSNAIGAISHDHGRLREIALGKRVQHTSEHRTTSQKVQNLWKIGSHAGSLAGSEDESLLTHLREPLAR
jgi:hypothetical protein